MQSLTLRYREVLCFTNPILLSIRETILGSELSKHWSKPTLAWMAQVGGSNPGNTERLSYSESLEIGGKMRPKTAGRDGRWYVTLVSGKREVFIRGVKKTFIGARWFRYSGWTEWWETGIAVETRVGWPYTCKPIQVKSWVSKARPNCLFTELSWLYYNSLLLFRFSTVVTIHWSTCYTSEKQQNMSLKNFNNKK